MKLKNNNKPLGNAKLNEANEVLYFYPVNLFYVDIGGNWHSLNWVK
jgi:hypothetical protein